MSKVKKLGSVYTPAEMVNKMLDHIKYTDDILKKHVIDNSCGNGAFLVEITKRYCAAYFKKHGNYANIKEELEKYIHGIEIDPFSYNMCINNLNNLANNLGIHNINWDIINKDALEIKKYNGKMDYVIGNPPYVRVHNLNDSYHSVKNMSFAKVGMTDLFIVFYEIGIKMLSDNGILSYITPSSIINSKAGSLFRRYIVENEIFESFVDLKHTQIFKGITTFVGIITLNQNNRNNNVCYYEYINDSIKLSATLNQSEFYINDKFYFSDKASLKKLSNILNFDLKKDKWGIEVKNGLATLLDSVFIKDNFALNSNNIIEVIKASTGKVNQIIFPYNIEGRPLKFSNLDASIKEYLCKYEFELKKRSIDNTKLWYTFGRSQGVKDVFKNKLAINTVVKSADDLKLKFAPQGVGVYAGLYVTVNGSLNDVIYALNEGFIDYVKLLQKYKNGGYYTFSSEDVKRYLIYTLNTDKCLEKYE